jgi:hypothetical protein
MLWHCCEARGMNVSFIGFNLETAFTAFTIDGGFLTGEET